MTGPPLIPRRGLMRFKGVLPRLEFPTWSLSYTQTSSLHRPLAGFVACLPGSRTCCLYRSNSWKRAAEFLNRNCISKIFFFLGSIQDFVSEILSIIKNMTWIYYGSQLQFLNTLVRLVSNIFPFQRDREKKEYQTVISWGWMGRGVGEAMPERVSSYGPQMFLMGYLSWKYSTWKIPPQGALFSCKGSGSRDESMCACYVGLRVELPGQGVGVTKSFLLTFYDCGFSSDPQGSPKVCLWQWLWGAMVE